METVNSTGRVRVFSDEQLRNDIASKLRPVDIARKYGVTSAAVSKRIKQLRQGTATAVVAPYEAERFVNRSIDAIGQLTKSLSRVNLLMDACDEWLRDAEEPERYNLNARHDEVEVTYTVEIRTSDSIRYEKRKKKLSELMACLEGEDDDGARFCGWKHGEFKRADPRELILKTAQEARSTVSTAADLARMLSDAQMMQQWREVVLDAIARAAPEVRDEIVGEIRSSLVLRGLLEGPACQYVEVN